MGFKPGMIVWVLLLQILQIQCAAYVDPMIGLETDCTNLNSVLEYKSPGYDGTNTYPLNKKCGWKMSTVAQEADFSITFHSFDLEYSLRCYDWVHLYKKLDGDTEWTRTSPAQGYCGALNAFSVTMTGKEVLLVFKSDSSQVHKGFNATAHFHITASAPQAQKVLDQSNPHGSNLTYQEYDTVTLKCNVSEDIPKASITWLKLSEPMYVSMPTVNVTVNSTGSIVNVTMANSTMANYTMANFTTTVATTTTAAFSTDDWDNSTMPSRMVQLQHGNGTLQLHKLQKDDTGYYRCVATNKYGSSSVDYHMTVLEKCLCPKDIYVGYYYKTPYTRHLDENNQYTGVFYNMLNEMVDEVCNCTMKPTVHWTGKRNPQNGIIGLHSAIQDEKFDIYLPIKNNKLVNKYKGYYFLPMFPSPGIAMMMVKDKDEGLVLRIVESSWSVMVIAVLMAMVSGIIMWMLECPFNPEEFPRKAIGGMIEGCWWAFVTMTTVGYGDIAPISVPGRSFALVWILIGLVITAILTGVITTGLTSSVMTSSAKIYGTKLGAISNSNEYFFGARRNGDMQEMGSFARISKDMKSGMIKGALIDAYEASYRTTDFEDFNVGKIIDDNKVYGIAFGRSMSDSILYDKFENWMEANKGRVLRAVEQNVKSFKKGDAEALAKSADIFDPASTYFKKSVNTSIYLLIVFIIGGLMWEYIYLRPRDRMLASANKLELLVSEDGVKQAKFCKVLKGNVLKDVDELKERMANIVTTKAYVHKQQIKQFHKQ